MTVPQSLLVAALALAWLIVLVPMISRKSRPVEEAVEGRGFRVLQRSDATSRFRRRSAPVVSPAADSTDEDTADEASVLADYPQTEAAKRWLAAQQVSTGRVTGERGSTMHEGTEDEMMTEEIRDEDGNLRADESAPDELRVESATEAIEVQGEYDAEYTESEYTEAEYTKAEYTEDAAAEYEAEYAESEYASPAVSHQNHRRQGRGGFDPEAAEAARKFRYAQRQRVSLILLVLTLAFAGTAFTLLPMLWIGAAVSGLLLVLYLTYLRRQVRIEEDVRQRRLARLQRARQIRPEYTREDESPVTRQPEYAVAYPVSQVPGPMYDRRGRVVVDLEDDDPGFDDLEQYEPIVYKRASGQ